MEGTDVEGEQGRRLGVVVASSTAGSNRRDERRAMEGRPLKGRGAAGRGMFQESWILEKGARERRSWWLKAEASRGAWPKERS